MPYGLFTLRGKEYDPREGDEIHFVVRFNRRLKKNQNWWDFPDDQIIESFSILHGKQRIKITEGRLDYSGMKLWEAVSILSDVLRMRIVDPDLYGRSTIVEDGRTLIITRRFIFKGGYMYPWT